MIRFALLTQLGTATGSADAAHFDFRVHAMAILLAWAVLNLGVGGLGAAFARHLGVRIFLGANAAWNVVNLAIAAGGMWSALEHESGSLSGVALVREMVFFREVLLVNVGLDVGYVAAGIITWWWGRQRSEPWRHAIGLALVVQGLFLLGFDVVLTSSVGEQLAPLWAALEGG